MTVETMVEGQLSATVSEGISERSWMMTAEGVIPHPAYDGHFYAKAKSLACNDARVTPARSNELPSPRLISAPPAVAVVAASTAAKNATSCTSAQLDHVLHRVEVTPSIV